MEDRLSEYSRKRDFTKTAEPRADAKRRTRRGPVFVVQKHDASSLHYDFRLEIDGALTSWALPRGPSVNPRDKRLAVSTEDHPLDYADFEGVIPEGEYGAGTVLVWDTGTYHHLSDEQQGGGPSKDLERGHLNVWLEGEKLRGGYALTRMGGRQGGRWLLVKRDDEGADRRRNPTRTQPRSVLSGDDLDEVAASGRELR